MLRTVRDLLICFLVLTCILALGVWLASCSMHVSFDKHYDTEPMVVAESEDGMILEVDPNG